MKIYNSLVDLVGNTPMIKLNNFKKKYNLNNNFYAKLEYYNPAGSVKDRIAKNMLEKAIERCEINSDTVIIEPTSGNTGIGLAAMGTVYGNKVIIVMPDNMSKERIKMIEAYGAEVILTPAAEGMKGSILKANMLKEEIPNSYILSQFENMDNPDSHYTNTGKEIWEAMDGQIDILISCIGTGGTISGVGKYLKEKNPNIIVIGIEPEASAVLSGGQAGRHNIQGIGAGFIPNTLNTSIYDEIIRVSDEDAIAMAKEITKLDGVFVGISSGAAVAACRCVDRKYKDKNIVVIFPDSKDRYLSIL